MYIDVYRCIQMQDLQSNKIYKCMIKMQSSYSSVPTTPPSLRTNVSQRRFVKTPMSKTQKQVFIKFPDPKVQTTNNYLSSDTLSRNASYYQYTNPIFMKESKLFQEFSKEQAIFSTGTTINFNKRNRNEVPALRNKNSSIFEISSDINYLNNQVCRLRKELEVALLQKQELKEKVKEFQYQKQKNTNNKDKYVISLLQDYNNMKVIVEKLIEDNLNLNSENERNRSYTKDTMIQSKTRQTISRLQQKIEILKKENSKLLLEKKVTEECLQQLKSKDQEIATMKVNSLDMEGKLKELLDGLRFYHERFDQQKAQILDDHDNFKRSAISEICRLKGELLQKSRTLEQQYDFERDPNYIKLITY